MGSTMTAKILARAAGVERLKPGDVALAKVDLVTSPDMVPFIDTFNQNGLKIWDPTKLIFCFDHFVNVDWMPQAMWREHPKIEAFAAAQGVPDEHIFREGRHGISHHLPVEAGFALPGMVCIGVDTQSAMMGAANCFALCTLFGTDAALLTGDIWVVVPEAINLRLTGELPMGVNGKDVVYRLMQDLGTTVEGRVIEVSGSGVASLPMDVRLAIANGAVQIGALTIVFPADDVLDHYMAERARKPYERVYPDADADYHRTIEYDLGDIDYLVAGPHDIDTIRPLAELNGVAIQAANIGSCSSGRLSDLRLAAQVLAGRRVHEGVRLFVTPVSVETEKAARAEGILDTIEAAGGTVTTPGCGGCYSGNRSPLQLADGERCISTSVETVRGRMGSHDAEILLANAAVVAASAIAGYVTNPERYLTCNASVPA